MNRTGRKNTVLVELILVILFFSLSAAVTLRLFVTAHQQSTLSSEKTMALAAAQDVAEAYRAAPREPGRLFAPEEGWSKTDGPSHTVYTRSLDKDWSPSGEEGAYELRVEILSEASPGACGKIQIRVARVNGTQAALCALLVERYVPMEQEAGV